MDENHQNKTGTTRIAIEDERWNYEKKGRLWVAKRKKLTGFEDKTLWDKLNLFGTLAIPLIIALATIGFGILQLYLADVQHQQDQQSASLQHDQDQAIALDQQQATILQAYLDNIHNLILNQNLLSPKSTIIRTIAQTDTLSVIRQLDSTRNDYLILYLRDEGFIGRTGKEDIISFASTDLRNVHLEYADLHGINLSSAILSGIYLTSADLTGADLSNANLNSSHVSYAHLNGADLKNADLGGADLRGAYDLTQQQLDEVSTCKETLLPKGLTCHHNQ